LEKPELPAASVAEEGHGDRPADVCFLTRQLARLQERHDSRQRAYDELVSRYQQIEHAHAGLLSQVQQLDHDRAALQTALQTIYQSRGWRMLCRMYRLKHQLHRLADALPIRRPSPPVATRGLQPAEPVPAPAPPVPPPPPPTVRHLERCGGPRVPSERKFRVLYIFKSGLHDGCNRYRVFNLVQALQSAGIEAAHLDERCIPARLDTVLSYDLIVLARCPWEHTIELLLGAAQQAQVPVIFDMDDYLFDEVIIPHSEQLRQMPPEESRWFFLRFRIPLDRCAYFTGSTTFLAERAALLGRHSYRIRNGLNAAQIELSGRVLGQKAVAELNGPVRIGYFSGSPTHQADFRLVAPVLVDLLAEFPQLQLTVAGAFNLEEFPAFAPFRERIECRPFVDWRALPAEIGRVDINLIPLVINPFTEGKSDLKYYEAGVLEIPSVATPTPVLARSITHGVNGFLANTPPEWYCTLKALITDPELRQRLGRNAHDHVLREYTPEVVAAEAVAAYREILADHRRRLGASADSPSVVILLSDLDRALLDRAPAIPLGRELVRRGASVTFLVPPGGRVTTAVQAEHEIATHFLEPLCAVQIGSEIPCCDLLLATDVQSARRAHECRHRAGRAVYLVQEYEPAYPPGDEEFFRSPEALPQVTVGQDLADILARRHGTEPQVVPPWAEPRTGAAPAYPNPRRILVAATSATPLPLRSQALAALAEVHRLHPATEILFAGAAAAWAPEAVFPHRTLPALAGNDWETVLAETPLCLVLFPRLAPRWLYDLMAAGCPVVAAAHPEWAPCPTDTAGGVCTVAPDAESLTRALDTLLVDAVAQTELVHRAMAGTRRLPTPAEAAGVLWRLVMDSPLTDEVSESPSPVARAA
jgi:glycosyltransferase involved in cell wall biosynthesis